MLAEHRIVVEPQPSIAVNEEPRIAPVFDDCDHPQLVCDVGASGARWICLSCGFSLSILQPGQRAEDHRGA